MNIRLSIFALLFFAVPAWAECDLAVIESALDAPLSGMKPTEFDVSDISSTEGGAWSVYREADGRLNTIMRNDYGESGRQESRLSVVNRASYGIAVTRIDYLRHAFLEEAGPNATARRSTDFYYFCDGKPHMPLEGASLVDINAYKEQAAKALADMRDHPDIAKFTIGLKK